MTIIAEDNSFRIERLVLGPYSTNAYIVVCLKTGTSVLIDTPAGSEMLLERLEGTKPKFILLTHNHPDHTGALAEVHSRLNVPLAVHTLDSRNLPVAPEIPLEDGNTLAVGECRLNVLHTPGHTPGSLCFKVGRNLLSGDTIFAGGPGRTRTPADLKQLLKSLTERIFVLPDDTLIFPGHGNSTVLKKEREEFAVFSSRPHGSNLCGDVVWLTS
ncbi:MAG: MBL fold metallo-hydrolase [Chloroflexi bacterium]|nr:MBL fold metallo-hydrolase [Chloroflexota bacterium]